MAVLRRKRRQSNLTVRAVERPLYATVEAFAAAPGLTEVELCFVTADWTIGADLNTGVTLYCRDAGVGAFGVFSPSGAVVGNNPGVGPTIRWTFNAEADTAYPAWILLPADWDGLRSASGATVSAILNQGTGTSAPFIAAVQQAA